MSLVTEHLAERGVSFEVVPHRRVVTSLQEARELGVAAEEVLKTVALWTGGKYVLAVVPASRRLDLRRARQALEDPRARLATEAELQADFPGYELGALPPLGSRPVMRSESRRAKSRSSLPLSTSSIDRSMPLPLSSTE